MKYIFIPCLLFLIGYAPAKSQVSREVAVYLKDKGLILPGQLRNYEDFERSLLSSSIKSIKEQIRKATKEEEEERKMLQEQLDRLLKTKDKPGLLFDGGIRPDTLTQLRNLLMISIRSNFSMSMMGVRTNPTKADFAAISNDDIQAMHFYLSKLQHAGLVSPVSSARVSKRVSNREALDSFTLVNLAIEEMETEAYYALAKVKRFAAKMRRLGIYTDEDYTKVVSLAESHELTNDIQLYRLCEQSLTFDLNELPDYPAQYLPPILSRISELLPGLAYSGLTIGTDSSKTRFDTNYVEYHVYYELLNNGRRYKVRDFYSPADYNLDGRPDNEWKYGEQNELYTTLFNRILANQQSPYRLHLLHPSRGTHENGQFAVIALRKEQADSLNQFGFINIRQTDYTNRFTDKVIDSVWAFFTEAGLLNHLNKSEIDSCRVELDSKVITSGNELLQGVKGLVFSIDLEYGVDKGQYAEVTRLLAAASRNAFIPTDIVDQYDPDKKSYFQYGFTYHSKKYSARLQQVDDWLDPGFYELIQMAIKEHDRDGKFFALWPSDGLTVVYLTFKQFAQLKQAGLIESEELGIDNQ